MERKNKLKKAIKKRKKEANKVSVIPFTVTDVGEFIRTGPSISLEHFSYKIYVLVDSVALCGISFAFSQWESVGIIHFSELVANVFAVMFDIQKLRISLTASDIVVNSLWHSIQ